MHDQHCQEKQNMQKLDSSFFGVSLGEEVRKVGIYLRKRYVKRKCTKVKTHSSKP
jgi:hypothetical protein